MLPKNRFEKTLLASALALASLPALAVDYYIVTPIVGRTAMSDEVSVSLNASTLPAGVMGLAYDRFALAPLLSVTGDPSYTGAGVQWLVTAGSLPSGMVLNADGSLSGKPTVTGDFHVTLQASYRGKAASQSYTLTVKPVYVVAQTGGVRTWADGTVAASCLEYRTGKRGYEYSGATGDGVYRIQPPGWSAADVYCNMTTDGGGWTLVAWNKGVSGLANMPIDFFIKPVNAAQIANRSLNNASSSINVEGISKTLNTQDVMFLSAAYSATPLIEKNQGVWSYDKPDCSGLIGHTGRYAGCSGHNGNDEYASNDRFNLAIYPNNMSIAPSWLHIGRELCWAGRGWCDFEFYLR